jgi:acetoin:2,6-dichlorophenolindophenol oxidoreductase subunit alpha
MHWSERRVADNLDTAGDFHSVPGSRVDGNDVEAVFHAANTAIDRARAGAGPSFVECRTFRWRGHVGASSDIDVGVKRRGELQEWIQKDPIQRVEARLGELKIPVDESAIRNEIRNAVDRARRAPLPPSARVFEHVFAEAACGF